MTDPNQNPYAHMQMGHMRQQMQPVNPQNQQNLQASYHTMYTDAGNNV